LPRGREYSLKENILKKARKEKSDQESSLTLQPKKRCTPYKRKLRSKGVPFSDFRYIKGA